MRKFYSLLIGIVSFLGINQVSADTYVTDSASNNFEISYNAYIEYKENIDYMINYWEENFFQNYPYYWIKVLIVSDAIVIRLDASPSNLVRYNVGSGGFVPKYAKENDYHLAIEYYPSTDTYITENIDSIYSVNTIPLMTNGYILEHIFDSPQSDSPSSQYDTILFSSFTSENLNFTSPEFEVTSGDPVPTVLSLYDGSYIDSITDTYQEINLNDYSYVILSLKDYTPRDTFTSTMYVKGQLCPTTVYNYGLEEKKDYVSGYQTQPCSYYYNNFTPFTSYIKSEDINNHAIYYLTGYDSSKPNLVKVDTSVYDITYITSENENEPYASINGKNYPVLPYSSLTDTAILTEENGISDTWTCAKYDTNCVLNSSGIDVNDLFEKPLETLKSVWSAITSIFALIAEFIVLLPPTMQGFLYLAFGIAIILGIIKIIL